MHFKRCTRMHQIEDALPNTLFHKSTYYYIPFLRSVSASYLSKWGTLCTVVHIKKKVTAGNTFENLSTALDIYQRENKWNNYRFYGISYFSLKTFHIIQIIMK